MNYRQVKGYEGLYEISDTGIVRGLKRCINLLNGKKRLVKARVLEARINNFGYLSVRLSRDGKTKTCFIHRLIAEAFIPNPNNLPQINHISGIKLDNSIGNLEWVDAKTNTKHAYKIGLNHHQGSGHTFAVGIVDNINGVKFPTIKAAADYYEINYNTLRNCLNGYNNHPLIIDLVKITGEDKMLA